MSSRFHLAIPVRSIEESKEFYCDFLGCEEGNCEEGKWQDINFWGNELTLHNAGEDELTHSHRHHVDMADVCVPHFGIHLSNDDFHENRHLKDVYQNVVHKHQPYLRDVCDYELIHLHQHYVE